MSNGPKMCTSANNVFIHDEDIREGGNSRKSSCDRQSYACRPAEGSDAPGSRGGETVKEHIQRNIENQMAVFDIAERRCSCVGSTSWHMRFPKSTAQPEMTAET